MRQNGAKRKARRDAAVAAVRGGANYAATAKEHGVSPGTVRRWCEQEGVKSPRAWADKTVAELYADQKAARLERLEHVVHEAIRTIPNDPFTLAEFEEAMEAISEGSTRFARKRITRLLRSRGFFPFQHRVKVDGVSKSRRAWTG